MEQKLQEKIKEMESQLEIAKININRIEAALWAFRESLKIIQENEQPQATESNSQ